MPKKDKFRLGCFMEIQVLDNEILVLDATSFDPKQTLESGQMFRFVQKDDTFLLFSGGEHAKISRIGAKNWKIECKNPNFFVNYFDFNTNYDIVKEELKKFDACSDAVNYGWGIRILKQPIFETLVCFIISANNNIKRIKNSVEKICERFGSKTEFGYAFPTLEQLLKASEDDFVNAGLGYRASYMVKTLKMLDDGFPLDKIQDMETEVARQKLMTLFGVGQKVADCVLLFGAGKKDVFPVDTWIAKVWKDKFNGTEQNRKKISEKLVELFGQNSGICQQYLFYHKRQTS